jgi:hypothetical protein
LFSINIVTLQPSSRLEGSSSARHFVFSLFCTLPPTLMPGSLLT